MSCERIRGRLQDALDGRAERFVAEHLQICPACRGELESLRPVDALLKSVRRVEPPTDFVDRVMAAVQAPAEPVGIRRELVRLALTASVLLAAVTALWMNADPTPVVNSISDRAVDASQYVTRDLPESLSNLVVDALRSR